MPFSLSFSGRVARIAGATAAIEGFLIFWAIRCGSLAVSASENIDFRFIKAHNMSSTASRIHLVPVSQHRILAAVTSRKAFEYGCICYQADLLRDVSDRT